MRRELPERHRAVVALQMSELRAELACGHREPVSVAPYVSHAVVQQNRAGALLPNCAGCRR